MRTITRTFLSICLFSSVFIVGCGSELTEQDYIEAAKSLNDDGDIAGSVIELKNAVKLNGGNPEARYLLGKTYLMLRDGASAEKELLRAQGLGMPESDLVGLISEALLIQLKFDRVLQVIQPTHAFSQDIRARLHAARAEAYLGLGEMSNAAAEINIASALVPESAAVNTAAAKLKMNQKEFKEARKHLDDVFTMDAGFADAWSRLGELESLKRNYSAALKAYSHALSANPYRLTDRLSKVAILVELGSLPEAEQELSIVKQSISKHFYVNYLEGLIAFYKKDFSAAQAKFEQSLQLNNSFMPTNFYLGACHYQQGHLVQAESYLGKFDAVSGTFLPVKKLLVATFLASERVFEANEMLNQILAINPVDKVALNLKAKIANEQGDADEALAYFHKVVDLDPESSLNHRNLALGYILSGNYQMALKSLSNAEKINADTVLRTGGDQLKYISYMSVKDYANALVVAKKMVIASENSADAHTLAGGAFLGLGEIEDATKSFRRALEISPGDANATRNLASIFAAQGEVGKVKSLYLQSIESNPTNIEAYMKLARMEFEEKNHERARDIWLEAIQENPDSLAPKLQLSRYYVDYQQSRKALQLLMKAEESGTLADNPDFIREYGLALLSSEDASGAVRRFQSLVLLTQSANDYYLVALAYERLGDSQGMRDGVEKALAVDPAHLQARLLDVQLNMFEGNVDAAANQVAELRTEFPDNLSVLELEGKVALSQNRVDAAAVIFKRLTLGASKSNLITGLAAGYWQQERSEESVDTLAQWLERFPDDVSALKALSGYRLLLGQNDLAVIGYNRVVKLEPNDITSLNNLALLMKDSNLSQALEFAKRAHSLSSETPSIKDTLGTILLAKGENDAALKVLSQAHADAPSNSSISYHYSMALSETGHVAKAIELLEKLKNEGRRFPQEKEAELLLNSIAR